MYILIELFIYRTNNSKLLYKTIHFSVYSNMFWQNNTIFFFFCTPVFGTH